MKKEDQKKDVSSLSLSWEEKVKDIRRKAGQRFEFIDESPVTNDSDLFTAPVIENLSVDQIFTGNDDFYKSIEATPATDNKILLGSKQVIKASENYSHSSILPKALVASIAIVFSLVLYLAFKSLSASPSAINFLTVQQV
jgi:hypothetical protein